jgi:hypothetical protein
MGADFSRERFDPNRDYSGVLMQQGRVMLDADWNEQVSVVARRLRAAAADLGSRGPQLGVAGTAVVPRTTPDGFAITVVGGVMSIGRGRIYVDGVLAENHGAGAPEWDALLAETRGASPTPYLAQPYLPVPPALPTSGTHVVYVDVWERELTSLERPDLVEVAVGVDSTARTQVAWQVRALPDDATGVDCSTADDLVPGWTELVEPSAGRLTTGTVPVDVDDDPCSLPPSGGYRGLENQTYRVEIHDPGVAGTATFKWSRDNGSVAYPVEEVSATQIRPSSLGKDDVLRFRTGDWVEVLDDHRELARLPGDLRKVEVHDDQGTMTLATALSSDLVMTSAAARTRHLRVRRWDQHGEVRRVDGTLVIDLSTSATGLLQTPADGTAIVLEHGLTVELRAPGDGEFHQGDYWTFAARTSDTSVEVLDDAPPRGVHHHYARLGVYTFPDTPADEGDCRVLWPPECGSGDCGDCSVCVTPESHASGLLTIQDAVDLIHDTGGTVCLAVGNYRLDAPVKLDGTLVSVRGAGSQTVLTTNVGAFAITNSSRCTVGDLTVISGGAAPAFFLSGTYYAELVRLMISAFYEDGAAHDDVPAIVMRSWNVFTRIEQCEIYAPIGLSSVWPEGDALSTSALDVADCAFNCWVVGIRLDAESVHYLDNSIHDNFVGGARDGGIVALGSTTGGASTLDVSRNLVQASGNGIVVGTSGITVFDNEVSGLESDTGGHGILVSAESTDIRGTVWVARNQVLAVHGHGIACQAPVYDLRIEDNRVERAEGDGIAMSERAGAQTARVIGNQLRDVVQVPTKWGDDVGIQVIQTGIATVSGNVVEGVAFDGGEKNDLAGIRLVAVGTAHVDDNTVISVGSEGRVPKVGIAVTGPFQRVHVRGNIARHSGADVEKSSVGVWSGLFVGTLEQDPRRDILTHGRMFTVEGRRTFAVGPGFATAAAAAAQDRAEVVTVVENNTVTGSISFPAAVISVPGDAIVSGNQCLLGSHFETPTLFVRARTATLQGNRAQFGVPSIVFDVSVDAFAAVGNLTTRGIRDFSGNPVPPPWDALNPDGV